MENHNVSISMAIFNSHVSLPEGNARFFIAMFDYGRVDSVLTKRLKQPTIARWYVLVTEDSLEMEDQNCKNDPHS